MSITRLVELQDIDSQLEDLNSLLGDLPKMVDELNEKENSLKDRVEADKVSLKEINLNNFHLFEIITNIMVVRIRKKNALLSPLIYTSTSDKIKNKNPMIKDIFEEL